MQNKSNSKKLQKDFSEEYCLPLNYNEDKDNLCENENINEFKHRKHFHCDEKGKFSDKYFINFPLKILLKNRRKIKKKFRRKFRRKIF